MNSREWLGFCGRYLGGLLLFTATAMVIGGDNHRGLPTIALALAPAWPVERAFRSAATGEETPPSRMALFTVVAALSFLGGIAVGALLAVEPWEFGARHALGWAIVGAIFHPLIRAVGIRGRMRRRG